ncbi:hyaluronan-binding protein 2-like [Polymixia lowei]
MYALRNPDDGQRPKPCKRRTCGKGDCVLTTTAPFYECKCEEPFQPPNCRRAADVCQNNPCRNGGTCVDGKAFHCECPLGFTGRYCHVGPNDCYQDDGENYHGNVSETEEGFQCLHWNSYFILKKGTDPFTAYEDADGLGPHNFCRNPDGERKPWCFIRKGRKLRWDYCDVKKCPAAATSTVPPPPPPSPEPTGSKPSESPKPTVNEAPVQSTAESSSHLQFSTCGKPQPKKVINRIYGGLKSIPGAQPWQLSLQVKFKGSNQAYSHICGGALIDSCWALTAAHCIDTSNDIRVVAGGLSLNSDEPTEQAIEVERTIVHENYGTNGPPTNDIALLKLKGTNGICAKETQFVKAACLPDATLPDGKQCTISGWGATENADSSDHLLDAEVLLISQQTCTSPSVYGDMVDDGMICAGYLQGVVDSCQGDSGGPLTCENQGTHVLYGLVSWGDSCAKKNKPGVYTRVFHFLDWIKSKKATA